ncbi:hypothetical protein BDW42DRAFT_157898 [Aspergillus taichungensis]|uniref:Uncharacterized protein n=1 Tax=Aspergillus taichungensis TaxID=482145 RepID=A0A2J5IAF6_9EURO|nr:hypothetical protein BDW42DRAFT_157898 [Aspergillus taichungensis]
MYLCRTARRQTKADPEAGYPFRQYRALPSISALGPFLHWGSGRGWGRDGMGTGERGTGSEYFTLQYYVRIYVRAFLDWFIGVVHMWGDLASLRCVYMCSVGLFILPGCWCWFPRSIGLDGFFGWGIARVRCAICVNVYNVGVCLLWCVLLSAGLSW